MKPAENMFTRLRFFKIIYSAFINYIATVIQELIESVHATKTPSVFDQASPSINIDTDVCNEVCLYN